MIRLSTLIALTGIVGMMPTFAATRCVRPGGGGGCFSSIQGAINGASPGDTVLIREGVYTENVTVTKSLTLAGEDQEDVVIQPAISKPICMGGSLCGGAASNVILVEANNVTIHHLTVDGDNPHLTSGVVRGGADVDARNGIITNHTSFLTLLNLEIHHVTVRNIYLRGIYASTLNGTFNLHDNSVRNVQGDNPSICIFSFTGSGTVSRNHASYCNDAISANHSNGIQFLNNVVDHSGSGVHSDNAGDGNLGAVEVIRGNTITEGVPNAYGIFVFVPYVTVHVESNVVSGTSVGLSAFGSGAPTGKSVFLNNRVDGKKIAGSVGAFVTTDQPGFTENTVNATFNNNLITGNIDGIEVQGTNGKAATVAGTCNTFALNSGAGIHSDPATGVGTTVNIALTSGNVAKNGVGAKNETSNPINAQSNWWGCSGGPGAPGCDTVVGLVNFGPSLTRPSACALPFEGDQNNDDNH